VSGSISLSWRRCLRGTSTSLAGSDSGVHNPEYPKHEYAYSYLSVPPLQPSIPWAPGTVGAVFSIVQSVRPDPRTGLDYMDAVRPEAWTGRAPSGECSDWTDCSRLQSTAKNAPNYWGECHGLKRN